MYQDWRVDSQIITSCVCVYDEFTVERHCVEHVNDYTVGKKYRGNASTSEKRGRRRPSTRAELSRQLGVWLWNWACTVYCVLCTVLVLSGVRSDATLRAASQRDVLRQRWSVPVFILRRLQGTLRYVVLYSRWNGRHCELCVPDAVNASLRVNANQRSCSTSSPVSTGMGDCLRAGKLSHYVTSHPGLLSLSSFRGR